MLTLLALLGGCASAPKPEPQEVWVIVNANGSRLAAPIHLRRPVRVFQVVVDPLK